jgi:DNA-directed RNA polymerase subunit beta
VPLIRSDAPLVGTGMEFRAAVDAGDVTIAEQAGVVTEVDADSATVMHDDGTYRTYRLAKFRRSNQGTCINQRPLVAEGARVEVGTPIADGPCTDQGEMALGTNLLVAFMPWQGHNYEDAIILSQRLVQQDMPDLDPHRGARGRRPRHEAGSRGDHPRHPQRQRRDAGRPRRARHHPHRRGGRQRRRAGRQGDAQGRDRADAGGAPAARDLRGEGARGARHLPEGAARRVRHGHRRARLRPRRGRRAAPGVNQLVRVYVAQKRKIQDGDKLAGRHGNKGVISKILPIEDMPFMPDGTPVDIVLNPLGVPGRMNIGQVLETHLGWVAKAGWQVEGDGEEWQQRLASIEASSAPADSNIATPVFDGAREDEISGLLASTLPNRDGERMVGPDGKAVLFDGRSGEQFPAPVSVGYMYLLKLHHLVDDKIHARSTGPYSMITQQPLGGKAQFGGQRFGEMEVWALEAYGAAYALQELLTIKSDDVLGRVKVYEAIVKGENVPEPASRSRSRSSSRRCSRCVSTSRSSPATARSWTCVTPRRTSSGRPRSSASTFPAVSRAALKRCESALLSD